MADGELAGLRREAWSRGLLGWKLLPHQVQLDEAIGAALARPHCSVYVLECARRFGKTTTLLKRFLEAGLRNRRWQLRWAGPTAQECRDIVHPIFEELTSDCPPSLRPYWRTQDGFYEFPATGSRFYIRGTDNGHAEKLRGTACHLGAIDEAGYGHNVDYVLKSILLPQTITVGGRIILASNAPKSPHHEFCAIADEAELEGRYSKFTIDDNTSLSPEQIAQIEKDCGGRESTTFRREYLCERVTDDDSAVVPEWRLAKANAVREFDPRDDDLSRYYHRYQSLDHGLGVDLTACLFAFYAFPSATLFIEHERDINGPKMTTGAIAAMLRAVEAAHPEYARCHRKVADNNNPLLLSDLGSTYGCHFAPVGEGVKRPGEPVEYLGGRPKENLQAMVNELRLFISAGRLVIHPRCRMTIKALEAALWDGKHRAWEHHKKLGHFDHLAALMYLVRALDYHTNPVPSLRDVGHATHHVPADLGTPRHLSAGEWSKVANPSLPAWHED